MNRAYSIALAVLASGCPSGGSGDNPSVLWLALDGSETKVRLVDAEPKPF